MWVTNKIVWCVPPQNNNSNNNYYDDVDDDGDDDDHDDDDGDYYLFLSCGNLHSHKIVKKQQKFKISLISCFFFSHSPKTLCGE